MPTVSLICQHRSHFGLLFFSTRISISLFSNLEFKLQSDVIKIMRKNLKPGSFRLWRKRVHNTSIKHRKKFKLERKKIREKIKITDIY